jgi:LacI family transcriptional regulator
VPDLLHPFFAEIAKAISTVVAARGYSVIISSSDEDAQMEAREIQHLVSRQLDALAIASSDSGTESFERMDRANHPYVLIDRQFDGLAANYVGIDDVAAGRMATEHLLDRGCRTVAHIRGRENSTGTRRFEGYRQALQARGIACQERHVVASKRVDSDSEELGAEAMRLLLAETPRPDGVFCFNDPLAIGAMNAILDAGLRIPEDIAVIGCGNLHYNGLLRVPLSSIDQRSQQVGEQTAHLLLKLIESKTRPEPVSLILEPVLVERQSTRRTI